MLGNRAEQQRGRACSKSRHPRGICEEGASRCLSSACRQATNVSGPMSKACHIQLQLLKWSHSIVGFMGLQQKKHFHLQNPAKRRRGEKDADFAVNMFLSCRVILTCPAVTSYLILIGMDRSRNLVLSSALYWPSAVLSHLCCERFYHVSLRLTNFPLVFMVHCDERRRRSC